MEPPRTLWEWAEEAAGYLRGREREVLRQELLDHMEDRMEVLRAQGLDEEEAQRRVLEAMGDPRETGRLLRRVYRPWMTALLALARVLLAALLIPAIVLSAQIWRTVTGHIRDVSNRNDYVAGTLNGRPVQNAEYEGPDFVVTAAREGSCDRTAQAGGHEIRVLAAWSLWVRTQWSDSLNLENYVVLRVETPFWDTPSSNLLGRNLRLTADGGEPMRSYMMGRELGVYEAESFAVWKLCRNLTSCDYLLKFEGSTAPDRLELIYEGGSETFTLPVVFGPRTEREGGENP